MIRRWFSFELPSSWNSSCLRRSEKFFRLTLMFLNWSDIFEISSAKCREVGCFGRRSAGSLNLFRSLKGILVMVRRNSNKWWKNNFFKVYFGFPRILIVIKQESIFLVRIAILLILEKASSTLTALIIIVELSLTRFPYIRFK